MKLNENAVLEISRTFNSLTNTYATADEYTAYSFPGSQEWGGDECGCTDDRCTGFHHSAGERCGCLDVELDKFHDDLSVGYLIREWVAQHDDSAAALRALNVVKEHGKDAAAHADAEQQKLIAALFATASYLDVLDWWGALNRVDIHTGRFKEA